MPPANTRTYDLGEDILVDNVLFDIPNTHYKVDGGLTVPLKMAACRYRVAGPPIEDGITLLLTHSNGLHKEAWEPVLQTLLLPQNTSKTLGAELAQPAVLIREAWSFDAPEHGESADANQEALKYTPNGISTEETAKGIAAFVESNLLSHRIVPIGHSIGCVAVAHSMACFKPETQIPYKAMILIEPPMSDRQLREDFAEDRRQHMAFLAKAVGSQRSEFESREAAYEWICKRNPWKVWDDRVKRLFVRYGLRPVDPANPLGPVTTKCNKAHEVGKYPEWDPMLDAMDYITQTCAFFPYHFVFGGVNDIVPRYTQDNMVSVERGRKVASVTRIPGTGHMVVQHKPDALAAVLVKLLNTPFTPRAPADPKYRL